MESLFFRILLCLESPHWPLLNEYSKLISFLGVLLLCLESSPWRLQKQWRIRCLFWDLTILFEILLVSQTHWKYKTQKQVWTLSGRTSAPRLLKHSFQPASFFGIFSAGTVFEFVSQQLFRFHTTSSFSEIIQIEGRMTRKRFKNNQMTKMKRITKWPKWRNGIPIFSNPSLFGVAPLASPKRI